MEQVDASWWGDREAFLEDIKGRIEAGQRPGATPQQKADAVEARRLLQAQRVRAQRGRDPFAPPPAPQPPQPPQQQPQDAPDEPQAPFRRRPLVMDSYDPRAGLMAAHGPVAYSQGKHLQGMIDQTLGAFQDEHDSRVAQNREQRRMEHELQLEAMRQETILKQLQAAQEEKKKDRIQQALLSGQPVTKRRINGQWVHDDV